LNTIDLEELFILKKRKENILLSFASITASQQQAFLARLGFVQYYNIHRDIFYTRPISIG
jgi:hypothetical protein